MEIKNLKEFQQFVKICLRSRIETIKLGNLELKFSPDKQNFHRQTLDQSIFDPGPITVAGSEIIPRDENGNVKLTTLSEEQLLMWSSAPGGQES
jgi:hypothetical protein